MQCKAPVEPVEFSRRICQDAATVGHGGVQARYLNRLTPVSVIVKATENGVEDGARKVLDGHFKLKPKASKPGADSAAMEEEDGAKEAASDTEGKPATVSRTKFPTLRIGLTVSNAVRNPAFHS